MSKAKDPLIGTRIREYEILDLIGKGGMGAVYRARHVYLDEERAIKVIHGRLAGDKDFVDRFIREAKILIKLRHPNLVQLYEFGTLQEDTFFMVLELIRGESVLLRLRKQTVIAPQEAVRIIREAALGLNSAHQKGIVHRDMSPDNLMLVNDDFGNEITKVLDFGIAKPLLEATQHFTITNMFVGKPEYCSPEQCGVLEDREVIDHRSDIYSLAVTFYHMLCGRLPFFSRSPQGYLLKHASEIPKLVSTNLPPGTIPPKLDALIARALAKRREERQQSMEEFIRDLDQVYQVEPEINTEVRTARLSTELTVGNVFAGRYMVEAKLGEGGMATVYRAVDKILEIPVALKLLNMRYYDQKSIERFRREVVLTRKISHPNVCRIYDIGESEGIHYVSMEYMEGKTLADMLQTQKRLPPTVGLPIIKQLLSALQEAHRQGIVHRDLKPHNIMVDLSLRIHIMDFGICLTSDAEQITKTGMFIGTPHYMAPEQFETKGIDHRADIYSVGVMMYEMFVGQLPFTGTAPMAVIFAHLKEAPVKPSQIVPDFPPELESAILKAMEKDPANRFQSARDFLRALDPLVPGTQTSLTDDELAHRLVAERSYSRAIKLLNSMLQRDPANQNWKKLLNIATEERLKKDLRRVRSLIHKKNLIQAQILMEKISRHYANNPRVITHIRKLEQQLQEEKVATVESYLEQAEKSLAEKDWAGAGAALEAAWNLKSNDPRISGLNEKLQSLQQQDEPAPVQKAPEAAQRTEEQPVPVAQRAAEDPDSTFALGMRPRDLSTDQFAEEKLVQEKLFAALEPLSAGNVALSSIMLEQMVLPIAQPELHSSISQIQEGMRDIASAFSKQDYNSVPGLIQHLLSQDRRGLLISHIAQITQIKDLADQKQETRRTYRAACEAARILFEQSKWEEAIEKWETALSITPGDTGVKDWIHKAQDRMRAEETLREKTSQNLAAFEGSLAKGDLDAATEALDRLRKSSTKDLREQIPSLSQRLENARQSAARNQNAADQFQDAFRRGKEAYDQQLWPPALVAFREAASLSPGQTIQQWIEAASSQLERQTQLREQFESTIRQAEKYFRQQRFDEAKKALATLEQVPEESDLAEMQRRAGELVQQIERGEQKAAETRRAAAPPKPPDATTPLAPVSYSPPAPALRQDDLSFGVVGENETSSSPNYVLWGGLSVALIIILITGWFLLRPGPAPQSPPASTKTTPPPKQSPEVSQPVKEPVKETVTTPPATATTQSVEIRSAPSGAVILIDGKETGLRTPATLTVAKRSQELEVRLDGYEPFQRTINPSTPGKLDVTLTALNLPGTLAYQGNFPVSVYNGKKLLMDANTNTSTQLPAGTYTLTLTSTKDAFINDVRKVTVTPGQKLILKPPGMGSLTISTNPSNCKVYMDGIFLDTAPIFDYPVQSGNHSVRFVWEKLNREQSKPISLAANAKKTITAIIENNSINVYEEAH